MEVWVEHELAGCEFPDQRLKLRLGKVLGKAGPEDWRHTPDGLSGLGGDQGRLSVLQQSASR